MIKQVIVVDTSLHMGKGKIASQVSHACMKVYFDKIKKFIGLVDDNLLDIGQTFTSQFTKPMLEWMDWEEGKEGFTKIVARCDGELELKKIKEQADKRNIPSALILDNTLTRKRGIPTYTCIAVGPDLEELIDPITGSYKLL